MNHLTLPLSKFLFGCYEIPGYGGASTAAYRLFECVQRQGYDAAYVNLVSQEDDIRFKRLFGMDYGNPKGLKNVHNCLVTEPLFSQQHGLRRLLATLESDIMIGFDYLAAWMMKRVAPRKYLIFYTMGCDQLRSYVAEGHFPDLQSFLRRVAGSGQCPPVRRRFEREAVEHADLVVTHCDVVKFLYSGFFPEFVDKIHDRVIWVADWIHEEALEYRRYNKPFAKRTIDLLFVASSWRRREKNYDMIRRLVPRLEDLRIHVLGETDVDIPGVEHHGLVTNRASLFSIFGDTKTVANLSRYDAAPQILFEGSALGCNLVTSKSSGNRMICNESLIVDPLGDDEAVAAVKRSNRAKVPDNIQSFLHKNSYNYFIEILSNL